MILCDIIHQSQNCSTRKRTITGAAAGIREFVAYAEQKQHEISISSDISGRPLIKYHACVCATFAFNMVLSLRWWKCQGPYTRIIPPYADNVRIILTSSTNVKVVRTAMHLYLRAAGSSLNLTKPKTLPLGRWNMRLILWELLPLQKRKF
jgi:hypothetical protein